MTCIFIKVPLQQTAWRLRQNILTFGKLWQKLQEDKDQYFPEQEIVGWFLHSLR